MPNRLLSIFKRLWQDEAFILDLDFDVVLQEALASDADNVFSAVDGGVQGPQASHEECRDLLRDFISEAVQERDTDYGLDGVDLCILMLRGLVESDVADVVVRRAQFVHDVVVELLADEELMDELKMDYPKIEEPLQTVLQSFGGESATARLRILLVRTGIGAHPSRPKSSALVKALARLGEVRLPASRIAAENEVVGRDEVRAILRRHLNKRRPAYETALWGDSDRRFDSTAPFYDLVVTQSRGSDDLESVWLEPLQGVDAIVRHPSALVLSPPSCTSGRLLLERASSRDEAVLIAWSGNDIIAEESADGEEGEFQEATHQNVKLVEVEDLLRSYWDGPSNYNQNVVFERGRMRQWDADGIKELVQRVLGDGHA